MFSLRNILITIVAFASVVSSFVLSHKNTKAPKCSGFNIAIIDGQKLKSTAKCFKGHDKLAEKLSGLVTELRKFESEIRKMSQDVKSNKKLSAKQKDNERNRIEQRWNKVASSYLNKVQDIRNKDSKLSELIQSKLTKIIELIARLQNIDIVLSKCSQESINVFYNKPEYDITDIIINQLDKEISDINIEEL